MKLEQLWLKSILLKGSEKISEPKTACQELQIAHYIRQLKGTWSEN